jgi:hypothetical protein
MGRTGRGTSQVVYAVFGRRRAVTAGSAPTAWMSALDRFARSVHRFHDRVEVIPDRQLRGALQEPGAELDTALASARSRARTGLMRRDDLAPAVRVLRGLALCARTAESAVAAATASRNQTSTPRPIISTTFGSSSTRW